MDISPHFSYDEVIRSKTATDLGMDNNLPPELLPKVQLVANEILEKTRANWGKPVKINSWYRCPALNQMISNNPNSQHTKGEAVDFTIPGINNFEVASYIRDNLLFDQLILERYDDENPDSGWVHCSFVDTANRKSVLRTVDGNKYLKGLS